MGRLILGVLIGFAVTFLGVMGATWAAMTVAGLEIGDVPTGGYLTMNLVGSFIAAGLGGYVASAFAHGRMAAAWLLAGGMVLMSLGTIFGEPASGQPGWYPVVIALLAVAGAAIGGFIAHRTSRSPEPAAGRGRARDAGGTAVGCIALLAALAASAATPPAAAQAQEPAHAPALLSGLDWRMVGPYRGGRSDAVGGIAERPGTFFMGTTGGGVWKTVDYGQHWKNISDGFFGGSVGALDVADSDPNVIYVGMGSADIRGNTSMGRGLWKSVDGGKTWRHMGLPEAGQIGRVEVHPRDPDLVYVAALGHAFGKNPERGVFRSRDGGATWDHVLALNDSTGAVDLSMNPHNPREIYAGMWRGERKPWTMISGGPEGGVYKSVDSGDTWEKLGGGLPEGVVGKVGLTVSPANPDRVWAIIEAEPGGGVYRSDDAGKTWVRTNSENKLRQRAWYYTHVKADPRDENTVWALNTGLYRSVDGGKTFEQFEVPHGDIHDLWINPLDPEIMVVGDDGGAQVTVTGGRSWSSYYNQPTAELYDVIVDNRFPYRLYGSQQDNTGISIPAWMGSNTIYPKQHWEYPSSCETGPIALHPDHPNVIYGGCYGGAINRLDTDLDQRRNVIVYPQLQLGQPMSEMRERFQWVSPIVVSPHDPNVVYHASQRVHRSTDGGMSWETISPDLTHDDPAHQRAAGGPINADVTGVEVFGTVFSLAVSPHQPAEIWAGSDDGRIHVTRDGGASWTDITPRGMPRLGTVDEIDLSVHRPGRAVVAVQRYRMDDFSPYIFVTDDHGRSWRRVADGRNGIPSSHPVRTVREDPERPGLLYAGTEYGIFVSWDDGRRWQPLQLDLPITPVTGMRVAHGDLIVSTQGRSFWILEEIAPLRQLADSVRADRPFLFAPSDAYRAEMAGCGDEEFCPEQHPNGAILYYHLPDGRAAGAATLEVLDAAGRVVRTFASDSATAAAHGNLTLDADSGMQRVVWDLTYRGPDRPEGVVVWGYDGGVKAPPGTYRARLTVGDYVATKPFRVLQDPRLDVPQSDYEEQFRVAVEVRDSLDAVYSGLRRLRSVSEQIDQAVSRAGEAGLDARVAPLADTIQDRLEAVEVELTQVRSESGQDPIRFPGQLDNQYLELYGFTTGRDGYIAGGPEGRPTRGAYERMSDLHGEWAVLRARLREILRDDVARFNALIEGLGLPAVVVDRRGPIT